MPQHPPTLPRESPNCRGAAARGFASLVGTVAAGQVGRPWFPPASTGLAGFAEHLLKGQTRTAPCGGEGSPKTPGLLLFAGGYHQAQLRLSPASPEQAAASFTCRPITQELLPGGFWLRSSITGCWLTFPPNPANPNTSKEMGRQDLPFPAFTRALSNLNVQVPQQGEPWFCSNTGTLVFLPNKYWLPLPASPFPVLPRMAKRGDLGVHDQCPVYRW